MSYYRLYFRQDGPTGPISGVDDFDAADDAEAIKRAETHAGDHAMELWCGKRKVRFYEASRAQA